MTMINRRDFVRLAAGVGAGMGFSLTARAAADGFTELRAEKTEQKLYDETAPASSLWTYNGSAPGPEIRVKRGERVRIRLVNRLDDPTSIHWHGIRIANAMDGVAGLTQEPVLPGESFDYDFVVPDAGTYWYHAHNRSWDQVARGLYGPLIVEDEIPAFEADQDLTLVLDDWRLDQDGKLDVASIGNFMDWTHAGRLGNWLTVNGRSIPDIPVTKGRFHRLRLINASNARVLFIDPKRIGARILAYDGQGLPEPQESEAGPLAIGPAQRVDLAFQPTEEGEIPLEEMTGDAYVFARFIVGADKSAGGAAAASPVLIPNPIPEPVLAGANEVLLRMQGGAMGSMGRMVFEGRELSEDDITRTRQVWSFNGVANLAEEPLFRAGRGETAIIETINDTAFPHAMHVHGHHFRVIERDGAAPTDQPWRDTFMIDPGKTAKIAFVADNPGKWLLHCHMLEHAAAGMNTWFEVT